MIKVTRFFESYHDLGEDINKIERLKGLGSGNIKWKFGRRRYETLSFVHYRVPGAVEEVFTPQEKEAFEQGVGLIEILNEGNLKQIPFTQDIDVLSLKRNWCRDYCVDHGYMVTE